MSGIHLGSKSVVIKSNVRPHMSKAMRKKRDREQRDQLLFGLALQQRLRDFDAGKRSTPW